MMNNSISSNHDSSHFGSDDSAHSSAHGSKNSSRAQPQTKTKKKHNLVSRCLALPALLVVFWGAWQVTEIGLANAWYFNADNYLTLWNKNEQLFTEKQFQQANQAIDKAIQLHPSHPHYLLTKAKVSEWGWYRGLMTSAQLEQQDALYQRAIAMRPSWPNAYADHAYYLGVTQKQITAAFAQLALAQQYGPYMPETFVRTLAVGFANWPVLNIAQKANTLQALEHAVRNDYRTYQQAVQLSKISGKLGLACSFLLAGKDKFSEAQLKQIQRDFCQNRPS